MHRRKFLFESLLASKLIASLSAYAKEPEEERRKGKRREQNRRAGKHNRGRKGSKSSEFHSEVPEHPIDFILGRPTPNAVTLSVLSYEEAEGYVEYGTASGQYSSKTYMLKFPKDTPLEIVLEPLQRNTRYFYRVCTRTSDTGNFTKSAEYMFHTPRLRGEKFAFTVQADSHLDENTLPGIYLQTLKNAALDNPDFHIDLGDTFMTGKMHGENLSRLYLAQRWYFGQICHSAPLFLVLGNHDGEIGTRNNLSIKLRKTYFPNPFPNGFYTGNDEQDQEIGFPEDYYAWEWGDALFIALDPFRYSPDRRERGRKDNWNRTLGEKQYRWLRKTLETSRARFKFVFIHHLVGGLDDNGRGGSEAAGLFEWGGYNYEGEYEFNQKRPGWPEPIHPMLVKHGVNIVFHGHDHFFARQEKDGIIYQLVPQPGHPGGYWKTPRQAEDYGYIDGDFLSSSGHLRVTVSPDQVAVDYICSTPGDLKRNGEIAFSYTIPGN